MRAWHYLAVWGTFARNSLVRDMTFRWNFLINAVSSLSWVFMNLGFYTLIFHQIGSQGELAAGSGWRQYEFFVFLSTTLFVNSLVQAFFMPNAEEFSELIRRGGLDYVLVKPMDTQFLVSLQQVQWSALANFAFGGCLLAYSLYHLEYRPGWFQVVAYPFYVLCGVVIFYSLMIALASTSIWLGRNQSLYNFWFYLTNFSRYPMEIYRGPVGDWLRWAFTFVVPVLVVVNVPARLMAKPLEPDHWYLMGYALLATAGSFWAGRWVFQRALSSYRSASS